MPKKIQLPPEAAKAMKKQLKAFRKKFNRDPRPDEPIFFDPDADTPQFQSEESITALWEQMLVVAKKANIPPELLYAMRKTGRIVTAENMQHLTQEELDEWNAAIDEFKALN
jgi:hypothetical protein